MAPIEIYGMQGSAPCRILEMTAECLGLEYEFKVVDLAKGDNRKPEYLAMNPMHTIPTLKDGVFICYLVLERRVFGFSLRIFLSAP